MKYFRSSIIFCDIVISKRFFEGFWSKRRHKRSCEKNHKIDDVAEAKKGSFNRCFVLFFCWTEPFSVSYFSYSFHILLICFFLQIAFENISITSSRSIMQNYLNHSEYEFFLTLDLNFPIPIIRLHVGIVQPIKKNPHPQHPDKDYIDFQALIRVCFMMEISIFISTTLKDSQWQGERLQMIGKICSTRSRITT